MTRNVFFTAILMTGMGIHLLSGGEKDLSRITSDGQIWSDPRLASQRSLRDKYHPWMPAKNSSEWTEQSQLIRERVLVSAGLWPMLPKLPIDAVIHGKITRDDYTIEKVYFESLPGHYVSGNLYRPSKIEGKIPAVLSPHGHWANGRFHDAGDQEAEAQIKSGAEKTSAGAHFPQQARMVQLARMGCVVFHYDMVGMADSKPVSHGAGFLDVESELRLQNAFGLQSFNSIRALDFLLSLPEVDQSRVGVTGESGGGTQTFILGAIDPRPTAAFPAVMVSTDMQGGCNCENADYLRIGLNNVAFAALFAPKPLAMSGADDWTINIETKGLPELKQIYGLYQASDLVHAKCFPQFGHNYNRPAREMMYEWFNIHLKLGQPTPLVERDFVPVKPADLSVFNEDHPRPANAKDVLDLRAYLTDVSEKQFNELIPKDASEVEAYRTIVGTAAGVMLDARPNATDSIKRENETTEKLSDGVTLHKMVIVRTDDGARIPTICLVPEQFQGILTLWIDGQGKSHLLGEDGQPKPEIQNLLDQGTAVASADLLLTGEARTTADQTNYLKVDSENAAKTFTYNRPLLSQRVRDVVAVTLAALSDSDVSEVKIVGTGEAGLPVLLAASQLRSKVKQVITDLQGFDFTEVKSTNSPTYLAGGLKYGGVGGLAALSAPVELHVAGVQGLSAIGTNALKSVYNAEKGALSLLSSPLTPEMILTLLSKK